MANLFMGSMYVNIPVPFSVWDVDSLIEMSDQIFQHAQAWGGFTSVILIYVGIYQG